MFAHLPDRLGGVRVAAGSLAVEGIGQALLWWAPSPWVAAAGALLSGIGFSLVFPSMGVEAARRLPPAQRGRAVGNFLAFFDLAIGATGPLVGLIVAAQGTPAAFLTGLLATLAALAMLPAVSRMRMA